MSLSTLNGQNGKFYIVYILLEGRKERKRSKEKKGGRKRNVRLNPMRCRQIIEK